uniref:Auxin efflux carrier component n=1 Tax=Cajanus cajan TaxID=3821 RepID=A0A151TQI1_CAJCA|nr:Putative auxin efflux carrier component 5 [Cajanus cajan]
MISLADAYHVVAATVPLYVTMILAYVSVKWWKIFSPDQCSGINKFVAKFSIPLLSFQIISSNNIYKMSLKLMYADFVQKLLAFLVLIAITKISGRGGLKWIVTGLSLTALPNTLILGIPLMKAMYKGEAVVLLAQVIFLQSMIWYNLLLFLYELDAVKTRPVPPSQGSASDGNQSRVMRVFLHVRIQHYLYISINHVQPNRVNNIKVGPDHIYILTVSTFLCINIHSLSLLFYFPSHFFLLCLSNFPITSLIIINIYYLLILHFFFSSHHFDRETETAHEVQAKREEDNEPRTKRRMKVLPILLTVGKKLIRNPNTYATLMGFIWSSIRFRWGLHMPEVVSQSIEILSNGGLGMAMFSLGLFMASQSSIIACGPRMAMVAIGLKVVVGPALMALASLVIGLRDTLFKVAVVQAALPQGIVPFVFAKEYDVHPAVLSTAILLGMLIALPVELAFYFLLAI